MLSTALRSTLALNQATGIGGVGGIFGIPPLAENFSKIPPLEILGKFFENPGKNGEN